MKRQYIYEHSNKNIYCEYIAYKLCAQEARQENKISGISLENPLSIDSQSTKSQLLKFQVPKEVYTIGNTTYQQDFNREFEVFRDRNFQSYKEFDDFYAYFLKQMPNFDSFRNIQDRFMRISYSYNFAILKNYIEQKNKDINNYRKKWGSSDNDYKIKVYYDKIIKSEPFIHNESFKIKQ